MTCKDYEIKVVVILEGIGSGRETYKRKEEENDLDWEQTYISKGTSGKKVLIEIVNEKRESHRRIENRTLTPKVKVCRSGERGKNKW